MEEEMKLYPLRFCTLEDTYSWGKEEFRLADLGYRDSLVHDGWLAGNSLGEVMDMYMDRVVGENVFEFFGRQFPLCVRSLKVRGRMPLRVHPADELAAERYDFLGKEKLWYVLRAGKDARIMLGFRSGTDAGRLLAACEDGSVEDILNSVSVHAGQAFRIAPGTVHCACGDLDIIEISESSPLDFCLCSWGEEVSEDEFDPALTAIDALDFIDYAKFSGEDCGQKPTLVDIPQFKVDAISLKTPLKVNGENFDSFTLYVCLNGGASVQLDVLGQKVDYKMEAGTAVLIPAECAEFSLVPLEADTRVLDVTVPFIKEKDTYINPNVPSTLEEQ